MHSNDVKLLSNINLYKTENNALLSMEYIMGIDLVNQRYQNEK